MVEESPSLGCVVSGDHRIITTLAYSAVCPLLGEWPRQREANSQKLASYHSLLYSEKVPGPRLRPTSTKDALENFPHLPFTHLSACICKREERGQKQRSGKWQGAGVGRPKAGSGFGTLEVSGHRGRASWKPRGAGRHTKRS